MEFNAIILAYDTEGKMNSKIPKPCHNVAGKPMIACVYDALTEAGAFSVAVLAPDACEELKAAVGENALFLGYNDIKAFSSEKEAVVFMNADMPLVKSETIKQAVKRLEEKKLSALTVTADEEGFEGNGFFEFYVFSRDSVSKANGDIPTFGGEKAFDLSEKTEKMCPGDIAELSVIDDRAALAYADGVLRKRINEKLMRSGVTIIDPERTYISDTVSVGRDTVILPGCILSGETVIGEDCVIGPDTTLENAVIGDGTHVQKTVGQACTVGKNTTVGPFAYLRPSTVVGDNCRIGDFVELKNSVIGNGTKVSHLTYVGDSDVGERVNFGCGTVTVNYDGAKKYRTTIGNDVFVGCNSNLVAPVTLADGAYTAAGSTITDDVPNGTLAIARARQVNKEQWNDRRKAKK